MRKSEYQANIFYRQKIGFMKDVLNIILESILAAFLVFVLAEFVWPGAGANFIPLGGLFILVLIFAILSTVFSSPDRGRVIPLISVPLTLMVLGGTIIFTWSATKELGKIGIVATLGAAAVVSGALKSVFEQKE